MRYRELLQCSNAMEETLRGCMAGSRLVRDAVQQEQAPRKPGPERGHPCVRGRASERRRTAAGRHKKGPGCGTLSLLSY